MWMSCYLSKRTKPFFSGCYRLFSGAIGEQFGRIQRELLLLSDCNVKFVEKNGAD